MSGMYLTTEKVQQAREFLLQYLRDSGYTGSLEDGTGIYDVLIQGFSLLYSMMQDQADKVSGFLSLDKAQENQALLGDDYDNAVDAILSNWFVSRKAGIPTTGVLRLWFTTPTSFLHLVPTERAFKYEDVFFKVVKEYIFSETDFHYIRSESQIISEYFVDVEVASDINIAQSIPAASIFSAYLNNVYFIRAEAVTDFELGKDKELNEEFISRTDQAITTRELITYSAIKTVVTQEYPTVTDVYVAGHGSPEQIRDIVTFEDVAVHVGNKADIYVVSPLNKTTIGIMERIQPDMVGSFPLSSLSPDTTHVAHILKVESFDYEGNATPEDYTIETQEDAWLTPNNPGTLEFKDLPLDRNIEITLLYSPVVPSVGALVTSSNSKVVCYDPVVKSMHPVVLEFTLQTLPSDTIWAAYADRIKIAIRDYVIGINYTESYSESVMFKHIHTMVPELKGMAIPIVATYTMFNEHLGQYVTQECPAYFAVPYLSGLSQQISNNTIQFYTDITLINIVN